MKIHELGLKGLGKADVNCLWLCMSNEVVNSITVNEFKGKYDRWLGIVD